MRGGETPALHFRQSPRREDNQRTSGELPLSKAMKRRSFFTALGAALSAPTTLLALTSTQSIQKPYSALPKGKESQSEPDRETYWNEIRKNWLRKDPITGVFSRG